MNEVQESWMSESDIVVVHVDNREGESEDLVVWPSA